MPSSITAAASARSARVPRQAFAWPRRGLAPRCVVCDLAAGNPLCDGCAQDYFAPAPRCGVCALRLPSLSTDRCGCCLRSPPRYEATITLADYAPPVDTLITALKFGGQRPLAEAFGRLIAQRAHSVLA